MDKTEKEILDFATRLHTESSITGIIRVVRDYFRQMDKVNQLKAEKEELKEINSQLMEYRKHSTTCQECYMDGLEDGKLYNKELHKYKQALTEIKEIAEHCTKQDLCTFCDYNDKCYKGFEDEALSYDVCKLILEKISEVLDD